LYTQILDAAPDVDILQKILGVIIVLFDPLPLGQLENILLSDLESDGISLALEVLHSILLIPAEDSKLITMYHESLRDFLVAGRRSKKYCIDLPSCNEIIARYCLRHMTTKFTRCFCALSHPDNFDSELWYACDYWVLHSRDSSLSTEIVTDVEKFGVTSLLCWIEALCLGSGDSKEVLPLV
jgi:hypothetical protein